MISLAIKYLTFHGYLVVSPTQQAEKVTEDLELEELPKCEQCGNEVNPLELAYQEGFHDGRQVAN